MTGAGVPDNPGGGTRLSRARVRRLIEAVMRELGVDELSPGELLEYVRDRPDHPFHHTLWGRSDAEMALRARLAASRRLLQRAVISVRYEDAHQSPRMEEVRAFVSISALRDDGAPSYIRVDPSSPENIALRLRELAARVEALSRGQPDLLAQVAGAETALRKVAVAMRSRAAELHGTRIAAE